MSDSEISRRARDVIDAASARGLKLAVAESLTGGLLADAFVSVPGASRVFSGGVVAYDTALKRSLLRVDAALLRERGPVDGEVAEQMAMGVRLACATPSGASTESLESAAFVPADIGVATTGVAGPDPDPQTGQPAGTVWIAVSFAGGERRSQLALEGDRAGIRSATVLAAIDLVRVALGIGSE